MEYGIFGEGSQISTRERETQTSLVKDRTNYNRTEAERMNSNGNAYK